MTRSEFSYFAPGTRVVLVAVKGTPAGVVSGPMNAAGMYPVTLDRTSYRFVAAFPQDLESEEDMDHQAELDAAQDAAELAEMQAECDTETQASWFYS